MTKIRARRADVPERTRQSAVAGPVDTACAFEIARPVTDRFTAEQWARSVFEGAPTSVRAFLVFGWRTVLGLPSRPRTGADRVLGWHIRSCQPDLVVLEQRSRLIDALNVVQVDDTQVYWTTTVKYQSPLARTVWSMVLPVHIITVPRLLARAARRAALR